MRHKGVIFDLDGTLVDTLEDISIPMNKALELHGYPVIETEKYREKLGWGIRRLAFLCLPEDARQDEIVARIADDAALLYAENPVGHSRPYPGMPELVAALRRKKIKTAVLTNKPEATARHVVDTLFPQGSFDCVNGISGDKPHKPDPACVWELLVDLSLTPADIIFIGDSEVDMETAVSSGCYALGASWGFRSRQTLEKAGARLIIDRPEELLELL